MAARRHHITRANSQGRAGSCLPIPACSAASTGYRLVCPPHLSTSPPSPPSCLASKDMPPSAGEDGPVLTFTLGRRRRNTAQVLSEPGRTAELARIWAGASKPRQGPGLTQPDSIWTELAGVPGVGLRWHEPHQRTPVHLWGYFLIPPLLLQR